MMSFLPLLAFTFISTNAIPIFGNIDECGHPVDGHREKRGAAITGAKNVLLWDLNKFNPIPYDFDPGFSEKGKESARAAIAAISADSCIRFTEDPAASTKIRFQPVTSLCGSALGFPGFNQIRYIDLTAGCQSRMVQTAHEIMHALAIQHTMTRFDRDNYVTVNEDSIKPEYLQNFKKYTKEENNNFDVPFDYGSIQTYPANANKKAGATKQIIVPNDIDYTATLGRRHYIQFTDMQLINRLYNCSSKCGANSVTCENGGFVRPSDCSTCVCPQYYTGARCERAKEEIILTEKPVTIEWLHAMNRSIDQNAVMEWEEFGKDGPKLIRAPAGKRIQVVINELSWAVKFPSDPSRSGAVPWGCSVPCTLMGIELNDGNDLTVSGKLFCCNKNVGKTIVTKSNLLGYKAFASNGFPLTTRITVSIVD